MRVSSSLKKRRESAGLPILSRARLAFRHTGNSAPTATFANVLNGRKQPIRRCVAFIFYWRRNE